MPNDEFLKRLSRLRMLADISKARVESNPWPVIRELEHQNHELRELFEEVQRCLSPDVVFDWAQDNDMRPVDIQGEALIRCNAALEAIDRYMTKS